MSDRLIQYSVVTPVFKSVSVYVRELSRLVQLEEGAKASGKGKWSKDNEKKVSGVTHASNLVVSDELIHNPGFCSESFEWW